MSCGDDPVSNNSSVSGRFVSEDGKAIEGALVRVFAVKPLDTLVTRLRRDYKDVGCDISDATEFDHRFYGQPLAEGRTNAKGEFSIAGLSAGPYHVSITHPQYSWRYIQRSSGNMGEVKTNPIIEIKGLISGNKVWDQSGQDYVVTENATFNGNTLAIKAGVRLRLRNQRKITIQGGSLIIEGTLNNPVWITSDSDSSIKNFYAGMQLYNSVVNVYNVVCSGGITPLQINDGSGKISHSYFNWNGIGVSILNSKTLVTLTNNVFHGNVESGFRVENSIGKISSCISYSNNKSAECLQGSNIDIENTYLQADENALYLSELSNVNVLSSELHSPRHTVFQIGGCKLSFLSSLIEGQVPFYVTFRPSGDSRTHTLEILHCNLYPASPAIYVGASAKVLVDSSFIESANTLSEYEASIEIKNPYLDESITITAPVYVPVSNIGLFR